MRARWILAGAMAALALTSGTALAQGRGHGRDKDKSDVPPGQAKKAERQAGRFDDSDQQVAHNWYVHERQNQNEEHELPPGLRDRDRLPPGIEKKLVRGWVVDRDDRERLYPPPPVLVRRFAPPPPGCRYVVFGGHVVLVDAGFRVLDVIHLELNVGM
jgi:hypothetical protein